MFEDLYVKRNQKSYGAASSSHAQFGLNSTLYLAYRDCRSMLQKHLFERSPKSSYRIFDYGCGAGLSTSIYAQIIREAGYKVEIVGADISDENLTHARIKVPEGVFIKISPSQSLDVLGKFDLIICNFVLVEQPNIQMEDIVRKLQPLLHDSGVFITTNATRQAYKESNSWYTLNNKFKENAPQEPKNDTLRLKEDQRVSLAVSDPKTRLQLFRFFDFFHSGIAYRNAYTKAGLILMETHRPIGKHTDGIPWGSELEFSPYKIHVLYPNRPHELAPAPAPAPTKPLNTSVTSRL